MVTIQDTGMGIPEDDLARIFDRFFYRVGQSQIKSYGWNRSWTCNCKRDYGISWWAYQGKQ